MTGPRTYDPVSGRFLQGDPVFALDPYSYCHGSPLSKTDSSGMSAVDATMQPPQPTGAYEGQFLPTEDAKLVGNTARPIEEYRWTKGTEVDAFVADATAGKENLNTPPRLEQAMEAAQARTANTGRENGFVYWATDSEEGVSWVGDGTAQNMGNPRTGDDLLGSVAIPKDARVAIAVHAHPDKAGASVNDVQHFLSNAAGMPGGPPVVASISISPTGVAGGTVMMALNEAGKTQEPTDLRAAWNAATVNPYNMMSEGAAYSAWQPAYDPSYPAGLKAAGDSFQFNAYTLDSRNDFTRIGSSK